MFCPVVEESKKGGGEGTPNISPAKLKKITMRN
jgi:hypothetical protein